MTPPSFVGGAPPVCADHFRSVTVMGRHSCIMIPAVSSTTTTIKQPYASAIWRPTALAHELEIATNCLGSPTLLSTSTSKKIIPLTAVERVSQLRATAIMWPGYIHVVSTVLLSHSSSKFYRWLCNEPIYPIIDNLGMDMTVSVSSPSWLTDRRHVLSDEIHSVSPLPPMISMFILRPWQVTVNNLLHDKGYLSIQLFHQCWRDIDEVTVAFLNHIVIHGFFPYTAWRYRHRHFKGNELVVRFSACYALEIKAVNLQKLTI